MQIHNMMKYWIEVKDRKYWKEMLYPVMEKHIIKAEGILEKGSSFDLKGEEAFQFWKSNTRRDVPPESETLLISLCKVLPKYSEMPMSLRKKHEDYWLTLLIEIQWKQELKKWMNAYSN